MSSTKTAVHGPVTFFFGERKAERFILSPEDSHHAVRVLRHHEGDIVWCIDGSGAAFEVELDNLDPRRAEGAITATHSSFHEPAVQLELICGMTQPARLDWIVEKATELGVHEIRPVLGSISPGPGRVRRWSRIARGAAKQCQRGFIPLIHEPAALADHLGTLHEGGTRLLADPDGEPLSDMTRSSRLVLAVGHDHGYSDAEREALGHAGFKSVSLGVRRLRTETAVLALLSWLSLEAKTPA